MDNVLDICSQNKAMSSSEEIIKSVAGEMALPVTQFRNLGVEFWSVDLQSQSPYFLPSLLPFKHSLNLAHVSHMKGSFSAKWEGSVVRCTLGGVLALPVLAHPCPRHPTGYGPWVQEQLDLFLFDKCKQKIKKDHKIETRLQWNYWLCHWLCKDSYKVGVSCFYRGLCNSKQRQTILK